MRSFGSDGGAPSRLGWRRAVAILVSGALGTVTVAGLPAQRAAAQAAPHAGAAAPPAPVATAPGQERLSQAQLEQLLAPIALHPDTLLAQMLMAATYPLEIVQAKRWLGRDQNATLSGAALETALQSQPWDASVKSLVPFPDVLGLMNDQLEWTQQLGDAVLAQQEDVLNAIQVLRARAQASGALQSGAQQTVTVTQNVVVAPAAAPNAAPAAVPPPPQIITIAPTQPETVYVPAYNPTVVYGTWPYPQYPPPYYPPPVGWGLGSALLTGMAFAGGVALVGSLWGWSSPNWGGGDININASRVNNINRNTNVTGGSWRHDTTHRQGVAYRSDDVRNRYQGDRQQQAASREQFRGRTQQPGGAVGGADRAAVGQGGAARPAAGNRPGGGAAAGQRPDAGARPGADRPAAGQRPDAGTRPGADRPAAGQRPDAGSRPGADRPAAGTAQRPASGGVSASGRPQVSPQPQQRADASAFQGMGQGQTTRAAADRGASSRQAAAARPAGGGGGARAPAGGGGGRAGGGRR